MPKFLITLAPLPQDKVRNVWKAVLAASGGSGLVMERSYLDEEHGQAICCWEAPDRASIEGLFARAKVATESIREVVEHIPGK